MISLSTTNLTVSQPPCDHKHLLSNTKNISSHCEKTTNTDSSQDWTMTPHEQSFLHKQHKPTIDIATNKALTISPNTISVVSMAPYHGSLLGHAPHSLTTAMTKAKLSINDKHKDIEANEGQHRHILSVYRTIQKHTRHSWTPLSPKGWDTRSESMLWV